MAYREFGNLFPVIRAACRPLRRHVWNGPLISLNPDKVGACRCRRLSLGESERPSQGLLLQVSDRRFERFERFERFDEAEWEGDLRTGLVAVMRYRYSNAVRRKHAKVD
ncbi:MAG: hypothetical protein NTX58_15865 [Actinobacteria bacterium]|nr:hypothetical protein [Actinomycetota bacterium]